MRYLCANVHRGGLPGHLVARPCGTASRLEQGVHRAGRRFRFTHVAGPVPADGEYLVEAVGDGAMLTYTLRAELLGVWRLAAPYLKHSGRRMMARSLENLRAQLEPPVGP